MCTRIVAVLVAALAVMGIIAVVNGTSGSREENTELGPVAALIGEASFDAQLMERHADGMAALAVVNEDHRHWASDAESVRASAAYLRYLADSARAILRDPGSHATGAVEITRVKGDGLVLQTLGQALVSHARAMEVHLAVMRSQASGDVELLAAIDDLAVDTAHMERDGRAAIARGRELVDEAKLYGRAAGIDVR